jgi:hypothetical protein
MGTSTAGGTAGDEEVGQLQSKLVDCQRVRSVAWTAALRTKGTRSSPQLSMRLLQELERANKALSATRAQFKLKEAELQDSNSKLSAQVVHLFDCMF